MTPISLTANVW